MSKQSDFYNEDYYQRGIEMHISGYQNYRWIPELTMPMAMTLIDVLGIRKEHLVLDFGCAYGFLVKAMRLLHRQAWGLDISEYVIENTDRAVSKYCQTTVFPNYNFPHRYDFCIAKDVFEHILPENINDQLKTLRKMQIDQLFAVIPLGEDKEYFAPANNIDKSHAICENQDWWIKTFFESGWYLQSFTFRIDGIKDNYYGSYPYAHGFFLLKNIPCGKV